MEGWERPHIRSRDSVQILVLPPNEPVTSHGLSRPEVPLIENTASGSAASQCLAQHLGLG